MKKFQFRSEATVAVVLRFLRGKVLAVQQFSQSGARIGFVNSSASHQACQQCERRTCVPCLGLWFSTGSDTELCSEGSCASRGKSCFQPYEQQLVHINIFCVSDMARDTLRPTHCNDMFLQTHLY